MKKVIDLKTFNQFSTVLLGFEVEFISSRDIQDLSSNLQEHVDEEVHVEDLGKYVYEYEDWKIRRKWGRGHKFHFEIVTPPYEYEDALQHLTKILEWLNDINVKTDKGTGLHINISYKNSDLIQHFNLIKFLIEFDEQEIFSKLNNKRETSFYSRSIIEFLKINPNTLFDKGSNIVDQINFISSPNQAVTIKDDHLELKYIGGIDYHTKNNVIFETIDKIISAVDNTVKRNNQFTTDEINSLIEKINVYAKKAKAFRSYNKFVEDYPNVRLMIDLNENKEATKAYFPLISKLLFPVAPTPGNTNMLVNYDLDLSQLQIKDAYLMNVTHAENIEFYDSELRGVFNNCYINNCETRNSIVSNSQFTGGKIRYSKVSNSNVYKNVGIFRSYFEHSTIYSNVDGSNTLFASKVKDPGVISKRAKNIKLKDE